MILALLSMVVLYRRHGGLFWWWMVRKRPLTSLATLAVALIYAQVWRWVPAHAGGPSPYGPPNADGILGAGANLARYMLQSIDLMPAGEHLWVWLFGSSLKQGIETLYQTFIAPLVGQSGAAALLASYGALIRAPPGSGPWVWPWSCRPWLMCCCAGLGASRRWPWPWPVTGTWPA